MDSKVLYGWLGVVGLCLPHIILLSCLVGKIVFVEVFVVRV